MKLLPVILQGKAAIQTNYVKLFSIGKYLTVSGLTVAGTITVVCIKNGKKFTETYPAGTTSITFQNDSNSYIYIIGPLTAFSWTLYSGDVLITELIARSQFIQTLSFAGHGGNFSFTKVDTRGCRELITLSANPDELLIADNCIKLQTLSTSTTGVVSYDNCYALQSLYIGSAISKNVDLRAYTELTSVDYSDISDSILLPGGNKITTLTLRRCGIKTLDLSAQNAITSLTIQSCPNIKTLDLEQNTVLTTIALSADPALENLILNSGLSTLTSVTITECVSLLAFNAPSAPLNMLSIKNSPVLEELNISSQNSTGTPQLTGLRSVRLLKCKAQPSAVATACAGVITNSDVTDGTVYLNDQDTYYSTVADAATAKGWTIEPLA